MMTATDRRQRSGTVEPSSYLRASSRASSDAGSETPRHLWVPRAPHTCVFLGGREHPGVHSPSCRDAVIAGVAAGSVNPSADEKEL